METINLETLSIEIRAEDKNVSQSVQQVSKKFEGLENTVSQSTNNINTKMASIGSTASGIGSIVSTAIKGAAVTAAVKFGLSCIEMASDLEEVQNVVDVTFGSMSGVIDEFANNAMKKFGMAELSAKQYAGTMGSILTSLGASREQSALMSMNLTNLAGDYSSFYNIGQDQAFEKIRSAVGSGETEAIKSLGVNMSVASLEAYRLSQGISVSYSKMDAFNQAILRYNYLISVSSNQMGDFARTSESYANTTRTISQEWDILKGKIGGTLESVILPFLSAINNILEGVSKVGQAISNVFGGTNTTGIKGEELLPSKTETQELLTEMNNDLNPVKNGLDETAKNANNTAKGLKKSNSAAKALKNSLMGFDEINRLDQSSTGTGALKNLTDAAKKSAEISQNINDAYGYQEELNSSAGKTNSFFGSASLSAAQIKSIVGQIVDEGKLKKMSELSNEVNKLENMGKNLSEAKAVLDGYDWMINAGFKVDEKGYKEAVDNYLKACNDYIAQSKKVVVLSAEILFGEGSKEAAEMNKFYSGIQDELGSLSAKIKKKVNEAWADGVITIDEQKEVKSLMDKYNKIIKAISAGEAKAKISRIEVEFDNKALNEESFKKLISELDSALQKQLDGYDEAYLNYTAGLYAQYELGKIDQKTLDQKLNEAKNALQNDINKAKLEACSAKINIIANMNLSELDNLKKDAEKYFEVARKTVNEAMADGFVSDRELQDLQANINDIASVFKTATPEVKAQAATLVSALEPNAKEWEKIASEYKKKGEKVPESISSGLSSYYYAKALTGDIDALFKLVGGQCEVSKEASEAFKKAYGFSSTVIDSLCEGAELGMPDVKSSISDVLKAAAGKMKTDTTASTEAKKAGSNATTSYANGVASQKNAASTRVGNTVNAITSKFGISLNSKGVNAINSFANGLRNSASLKTAENRGKEVANKANKGVGSVNFNATGQKASKSFSSGLITNSKLNSIYRSAQRIGFKAMNGIENSLNVSGSTSKKFANYGKYTVEGYNKGINDNKASTSKDGGVISKWVNGIGSYFMKLMGIHSPSRLFKSFGGYTVEGYNIGLEDEMSTTEDVLDDWASIMNGFCDNIDMGEIQTPRVSTNVPVADFTQLTNSNGLSQKSMQTDRPVNITLKVGETVFGKIAADSLNKLIRQEGEMVLDLSYV